MLGDDRYPPASKLDQMSAFLNNGSLKYATRCSEFLTKETEGITTTNMVTLSPRTRGCEEVPPPDGGHGWIIVASCATLNGFTWGVTAVS